MNPDPGPWYSTTLNVWTLAGTLVAVITLFKAVPAGWRLTLGRRRHLIAQLRKIAPGVRHDYVEGLLGQPKWQSTMTCTRLGTPLNEEADEEDRDVEVTVRTWPLSRLGYLVTWSENDAVVMYGITTTSWWFRPRVVIGETRIRLGKSPLSDLGQPLHHRAWLGNRRFGYLEEHYFGNPGGYRSWYVGVNDIGVRPVAPRLGDIEPEDNQLPEQKRDAYRAAATINTVVISGVALYEELQEATFSFFGTSLGVNQDLVRLTDPSYYVIDSRISRFYVLVQNWWWGRRLNRLEQRTHTSLR
ncbi:ETEC_3214 domain-containing protein [Streptomyces sp. NPDC046712]|uniref:ETEC_3214 domain-containing protein n=1 Tax=Streptomyces sp. NPDC046712 TaxID=3154802 RepID=UPI0033F6CDBB